MKLKRIDNVDRNEPNENQPHFGKGAQGKEEGVGEIASNLQIKPGGKNVQLLKLSG